MATSASSLKGRLGPLNPSLEESTNENVAGTPKKFAWIICRNYDEATGNSTCKDGAENCPFAHGKEEQAPKEECPGYNGWRSGRGRGGLSGRGGGRGGGVSTGRQGGNPFQGDLRRKVPGRGDGLSTGRGMSGGSVCRFFMQGDCRMGSRCPFSHQGGPQMQAIATRPSIFTSAPQRRSEEFVVENQYSGIGQSEAEYEMNSILSGRRAGALDSFGLGKEELFDEFVTFLDSRQMRRRPISPPMQQMRTTEILRPRSGIISPAEQVYMGGRKRQLPTEEYGNYSSGMPDSRFSPPRGNFGISRKFSRNQSSENWRF